MISTSAEQMNKNYFIDPKEKIKGVQKVCVYTFACKGNFVFTCYPDIEKVLDFKAFLMEQVFEQAVEQNKIWRSYERKSHRTETFKGSKANGWHLS